MIFPRVTPLGDSALTISWPGESSRNTHRWVRSVAAKVEELIEVRDLVVSFTTLSIYYDPLQVDYQTFSRQVQGILKRAPDDPSTEAGREFTIPVRYDGADLEDVAQRTGLTPDEVVARHCGRWYDVYLVGFAPGWAYLGELDSALVLPRRPTPRKRVPAGSVAIAGRQTGVYPFDLPGGWHLIGRTDRRMFDQTLAEPALLRPGDRVRFEAMR
jgi:KipI family sensor histidine kinase inhibitor